MKKRWAGINKHGYRTGGRMKKNDYMQGGPFTNRVSFC